MSTLLDKKCDIFNTFENLIDSIKSYDESVYFWIFGGSIRKVVESKSISSEWIFPPDIDIHCNDSDNFNKIKNILIKHMNFKEVDNIGCNTYLESSSERIDLQDGGKMNKGDYFMFNKGTLWTCFWTDYTISAITLDSNYNLYYHKNFFEDIESKSLNFVKRDYNFINKLIQKASNSDALLKKMKIFFGNIFINCLDLDDFNSDKKPRYHKHSAEGYLMSENDYTENKSFISKIKKDLSIYIESYKDTGWWQSSQWFGILQSEYGYPMRDKLFTDSEFKIIEDVVEKIHENDNSIEQINLKDNNDNI